jgi:hypothetical protein
MYEFIKTEKISKTFSIFINDMKYILALLKTLYRLTKSIIKLMPAYYKRLVEQLHLSFNLSRCIFRLE